MTRIHRLSMMRQYIPVGESSGKAHSYVVYTVGKLSETRESIIAILARQPGHQVFSPLSTEP